jgi:hypothetical protein
MSFPINLSRFIIFILLAFPAIEGKAQKSIQVFKLESPLTIDGIFEPEKWMNADSASNFIQMEPQPGEDASEKTVAYFGHDGNKIYAAIKCYQSTPIIAKNQSRDALSKEDDIIALYLDTYNDNRSGYAFL